MEKKEGLFVGIENSVFFETSAMYCSGTSSFPSESSELVFSNFIENADFLGRRKDVSSKKKSWFARASFGSISIVES